MFEVLALMGWETEAEQAMFIQLYHASGALTDGVQPKRVITVEEARLFLDGNYSVVYGDNIPVDMNLSSERLALEWLNTLGQAQIQRYRPNMRERNLIEIEKWDKHAELVVDNLTQLGFINEVVPKNSDVHGLMVLGGSEPSVLKRYAEVSMFLKRVKPEAIYLLSGERDLWAGSEKYGVGGEPILMAMLEERIGKEIRKELQESFDIVFSEMKDNSIESVGTCRDKIINSVKATYGIKWPTELDMMVRLFHQDPRLKQQYVLREVNAPKRREVSQDRIVWKRPTTKSTVEELITQYDVKGRSLVFMSSQPHSRYQEGVISAVMRPPEYTITMAAPAYQEPSVSKKAVMGLEAFFSSIYSHKPLIESQLRGERVGVAL